MDEEDVQKLLYFLLSLACAALIGAFFIEGKQDKTAKPKAKYMMDDYGNIYSIQPCKDCKNCIRLEQIDTAEIKVKAFDFVPR